MVGIKGTGMASLAVSLSEMGETVSGCDSGEVFSTDDLLKRNHLHVDLGFEAANLPLACDTVIYSSAYPLSTPILQEAQKRSKPLYSYIGFLAKLTEGRDSYVVSGTHGKTTVTAATTYLLSRGKRKEYPFFSIFGSNLIGQEGMTNQGDEYFLLEGCEYQDHFLSYHVRGALITTIEWDHPDYFPSEKDVFASFVKFCTQIQKGGFCIICIDGKMTRRLASMVKDRRPDLRVITYGFSSRGVFRLRKNTVEDAYSIDLIEMLYHLPVHSEAWADDLFGAALLATAMLLDSKNVKLFLPDDALLTDEVFPSVLSSMLSDLSGYPGTVGRMEVTGEEGGVTYLDDYAHHPSQIKVVMESLREAYPNRHILVLFRPHTASRTKALFPQFVSSLSLADKVIIQNTYASARGDVDQEGDSALDLEKALETHLLSHYHIPLQAVIYAKDDDAAVAEACGWLSEGELCVTMGAGNNRFLADRIRERRRNG